MEDNSASSFAATGGSEAGAPGASEAAAEAGTSHEVLMPGTSQVPVP
jgi:hypothetical protein